MTAKVKVTATAPGFFERLRKPGEEPFEVDENLLSKTWMARVDGKEIEPPSDEADASEKPEPKRRGRPRKEEA